MDKIEKIKEWVRKQKKEELARNSIGVITGKALFVDANDLLSFLDTLSEEPDKSLEEAALHSEILTYPMPDDGGIDEVMKVQEARIFHEIGFKAGAEWQKSQMLREAYVESQIVEDGRIELEGNPLPCLNPIILLPYPQFEPGDQVRLIVLKEEEE